MRRKAHRVDWTEVAERDLIGIVDYIADKNPASAVDVLERLERRAAALRSSPTRGRVVPELARLQVRQYRELIVAPYRLIYRIGGSRVVVLGVFDSRRNMEDVLLDRLIREP